MVHDLGSHVSGPRRRRRGDSRARGRPRGAAALRRPPRPRAREGGSGRRTPDGTQQRRRPLRDLLRPRLAESATVRAGKPSAVRLLRGARDRDGALRQGRRRDGRAGPGPARRHPRDGPARTASKGSRSSSEDDLREVEPAVAGSRRSTRPGRASSISGGSPASLAEEIVGLGATIRIGRAVHGIRRSGDRAVRLATTPGPVRRASSSRAPGSTRTGWRG